MSYVDGYLIVVPKKNFARYKKLAQWSKRTWMKHGALEYFECQADDLDHGGQMGLGFPKLVKLKKTETVMFSFIVYKSRRHRDAVNRKVMTDPGMAKIAAEGMPFRMDQFCFGGFKPIVEGRAG